MYLLDTNHCSAIIVGNLTVINYIQEANINNIGISVITQGELLYMGENSTKKIENLATIYDFLGDILIYSINSNVSAIYAQLKARIMSQFGPKEKKKRRQIKISDLGIGENDLWIASTAISNNLTLVSCDRDFIRIKQAWNFPLENWLS
ncbi:MAG: type II toxin-antitoxin system VapC family toxin [Cyanobacterium sp. T60_A2020_053]|nr:type II toxin-antitoxin system VapC family toxin [Cyanobacterium sp. T60_A2020_053]